MCIARWFSQSLAHKCCSRDLCTPWDLWRMLTAGKGADSTGNTCWQNWRKQMQVGFDHIKKKNPEINLSFEFSTPYGVLLQCRRSSNDPNNSLADNPLLKLMGITEKLVSLPCVSIEHWSLTCNKQNLSKLLQFFLQQWLGEWRVNALRCRVLAVPSPAQRWMVLNLHPTEAAPNRFLLKNYHFRHLHGNQRYFLLPNTLSL